jgi:hypothetical protein
MIIIIIINGVVHCEMDDFVEDLRPLFAQHPEVIILATITSAKCVADWFAGAVRRRLFYELDF